LAVFRNSQLSSPPLQPKTTEEAKTVLSENSGTQFDPHLVDVFLNIVDTIDEIVK